MNNRQYMWAIVPKGATVEGVRARARAVFDTEVRAWQYLIRESLEDGFEVVAEISLEDER